MSEIDAGDGDRLTPAWHVAGVRALMTTRIGGFSVGPFAAMNLRDGLGDDPAAVSANRARLAEAIGATPVFLRQVHGTRVVRIDGEDARPGAPVREADASVTTTPAIACIVEVADCLPVLFAAANGRAVGAAHAGWRGLAAGVVEAALAEVCAAAGCTPAAVHVWLGACIGPTTFEVGADVLHAFAIDPAGAEAAPRFVPGRAGKWFADLAGLAGDRLAAAGVHDVDGGRWCTVSEASRFFSFRRDGVTGRMAAAIRLGGEG